MENIALIGIDLGKTLSIFIAGSSREGCLP
jgi:hypothetical protein